MIDLSELTGTLDLWLCMWQPEERECFETALVRAMTDEHPLKTRALAFAACNVIATQRLLAAAVRIAERGVFAPDQLSRLEMETLPLYKLHDAATRLRGNLHEIEHLLSKQVTGCATPRETGMLDWIDVRDLVTLARTTVDARIFAEVQRRIARRGNYQRGRVANVLGFRTQPSLAVSPISGG